MDKNNNEHLSAFIDGEHSNDEGILEKLVNDKNMKKTWKRYHLIGDCLRGNLPEKINTDLSKDMNSLLNNEPAILVPKKDKIYKNESLIGFAIAASVALIAVISIQYANNTSNRISVDTVSMDKEIIDSHFDTFSFPETPISPASVKKQSNSNLLTKQKLNNYLINHSEYRYNSKMNSFIPHARIVTIESEE